MKACPVLLLEVDKAGRLYDRLYGRLYGRQVERQNIHAKGRSVSSFLTGPVRPPRPPPSS